MLPQTMSNGNPVPAIRLSEKTKVGETDVLPGSKSFC